MNFIDLQSCADLGNFCQERLFLFQSEVPVLGFQITGVLRTPDDKFSVSINIPY